MSDIVPRWLPASDRQPPPRTSGLVMNKPSGGMSHAGRLFQARMWRDYAMRWDTPWRREECLRRARVNLYLAARLRRAMRD